MNIAELWEKGKYCAVYSGHLDQAVSLVLMVTVALGGFACGRLSAIEERSVPVGIANAFPKTDSITSSMTSSSSAMQKTTTGEPEQGRGNSPSPGAVVASKNSDKYHLPWCSGAKTIKEENKIWFATEADAQSAGYTKAGNCK